MSTNYKGYVIKPSEDGSGVKDGVDIYKDGDWIMYKPTEEEAMKTIDRWLGNNVNIY